VGFYQCVGGVLGQKLSDQHSPLEPQSGPQPCASVCVCDRIFSGADVPGDTVIFNWFLSRFLS
jgi:hypothetical protein